MPRYKTYWGYDDNLIRPDNSELLNNEGVKKAIAIKLIEENAELSFDEALKYGEDFLKNGSCLIINAEVSNKLYHYSGPNRFRTPGFCCGGCF